GAEFLTGCPDGRHFAFYTHRDDQFELWNITGERIWCAHVNTDKTLPVGTLFSTEGDAIACVEDREGYTRLRLFSIAKGYQTTFDLSYSAVAHDPRLRRFLVDPLFGSNDVRRRLVDRHGSACEAIVTLPPRG